MIALGKIVTVKLNVATREVSAESGCSYDSERKMHSTYDKIVRLKYISIVDQAYIATFCEDYSY